MRGYHSALPWTAMLVWLAVAAPVISQPQRAETPMVLLDVAVAAKEPDALGGGTDAAARVAFADRLIAEVVAAQNAGNDARSLLESRFAPLVRASLTDLTDVSLTSKASLLDTNSMPARLEVVFEATGKNAAGGETKAYVSARAASGLGWGLVRSEALWPPGTRSWKVPPPPPTAPATGE
jgi:hypothetical protein